MAEQPYFDRSGEASDAPGRFVHLTFTVGGETRVMHPGDCVVIPPNVEHDGVAGPQGCQVVDVFTPPRAGIVRLMAD